MVIQLPNGRSYAVHFHYHELEYRNRKFRNQTLKRRAVTITLHEGKCPENRPRGQACNAPEMLQGHAECSPLDAWDRNKGRKLAFKRATQGIEDKRVLGLLWYAWSASKGGTFARFVEVDEQDGHFVVRRLVENREKGKRAA